MKQTNAELLEKVTCEELAEKFNISLKQATQLFKESKVFKDLIQNPTEYNRAMPDDLVDLWINERIFGFPVSSIDIKEGILRYKKLI